MTFAALKRRMTFIVTRFDPSACICMCKHVRPLVSQIHSPRTGTLSNGNLSYGLALSRRKESSGFISVARGFPVSTCMYIRTYVQGAVSCKNNFVRLKYSRYHGQYEIVISPKIVQWPREYLLRTEAITYL